MNVQTNQTLPSLDKPLLPQFFQLIKTGSALSDVREQVGELSVRSRLREFHQDFAFDAIHQDVANLAATADQFHQMASNSTLLH